MPKVVSSDGTVPEHRVRPVRGVSVFVSEEAMSSMIEQAESGYLRNEEILGLMTGFVYCDDEGEYAVAAGAATCRLDADDASVRFRRDSLEELFGSMDSSEGDRVVGWYHSHPGFGCYLSDTDIRTHEGVFGSDTGFALVIDPADSSIAVFGCTGGEPRKIRMVISESD